MMAMVTAVILCRWAGDFYPLNKFPMYADPGTESSRFIVVKDGEGALVDIQRLTGETSAKVGKKYVDARNDFAARAGIKEGEKATEEIKQAAWQAVAERLDRLAKRRKKELPSVLKLEVGDIYQENETFREVITPVAVAALPHTDAAPARQPQP